MGYAECANGHLYNTDQYASCPYCSGAGTVIDFTQGVYAERPGKTSAPQTQPSPAGQPSQIIGTGAAERPGKTVAPSVNTRHKTVSSFRKKYNIEPVVGWLTCISGEDKGKSFQLWGKINTIGSDESEDVCIHGDPSVSHDHAHLAYDAKHNAFSILLGSGSSLLYLNDEPVYTPTMINAYDIIELGDTKLIFIPLCSDRFTWDSLGGTPAAVKTEAKV